MFPNAEFRRGWRYSAKKIPNYRYHVILNNEKNILVDVYVGNYFVLSVGNLYVEVCKSIPSLVLRSLRARRLFTGN